MRQLDVCCRYGPQLLWTAAGGRQKPVGVRERERATDAARLWPCLGIGGVYFFNPRLQLELDIGRFLLFPFLFRIDLDSLVAFAAPWAVGHHPLSWQPL